MTITNISLQLPLHPTQLSAFRASIVELVGLEQELFHNHDNQQGLDSGHHHYQYPLIQYSVRRGKACVTGIGAGAELLRSKLLPKLGTHLRILGQARPIGDYRVHTREWEPALLPQAQNLGLLHWQALNNRNYAEWKNAQDEATALAILNRAIYGQLKRIADDLDLPFGQAIEAEVISIDNRRKVNWHGADLLRFDVLVRSNFHPAEGMGVGRLAAFGFGECLSEAHYLHAREVQGKVLV